MFLNLFLVYDKIYVAVALFDLKMTQSFDYSTKNSD